MRSKEAVNHPDHYGGADDPYEAVKVIEAWDLPWHLGDAVKYICRAGKKDPAKEVEDLRKAAWYVRRRIEFLETRREAGNPNLAKGESLGPASSHAASRRSSGEQG